MEIDTSLGHLLERMLETQENTTPFFRPFEQAWHKQLVEWLRLDTYADGMPSSMLQAFETEVQQEVEQWKETLDQAEETVRHRRCVFLIETNSSEGKNHDDPYALFLPSVPRPHSEIRHFASIGAL